MSVRLAVSMALDALSDQVQAVEEADKNLIEQRRIRNDLIKDARDAGIGYRRLTNLTGLSRDRLYTIVNSPSQPGESSE